MDDKLIKRAACEATEAVFMALLRPNHDDYGEHIAPHPAHLSEGGCTICAWAQPRCDYRRMVEADKTTATLPIVPSFVATLQTALAFVRSQPETDDPEEVSKRFTSYVLGQLFGNTTPLTDQLTGPGFHLMPASLKWYLILLSS